MGGERQESGVHLFKQARLSGTIWYYGRKRDIGLDSDPVPL